MIKRIHYKKGNKIYQSDKVICTRTGEVRSLPVTVMSPISKTEIRRGEFPVVSIQKLNKIMNNCEQYPQNPQGLPYAVSPAKDVSGGMRLSRNEQKNVRGQRTVINVTITNNEVTSENVLIGDHHNTVADGLSIGSPKAGIVFGGTWGPDTYNKLKQITGANPYRLEGIKFQSFTAAGAPNTVFFDNGRFSLAVGNFANKTVQNEDLFLGDLVTQKDQQTNIREDKTHTFLMDGFAAYNVFLTAGQKIVFSMTLESVATSYNMVKL